MDKYPLRELFVENNVTQCKNQRLYHIACDNIMFGGDSAVPVWCKHVEGATFWKLNSKKYLKVVASNIHSYTLIQSETYPKIGR